MRKSILIPLLLLLFVGLNTDLYGQFKKKKKKRESKTEKVEKQNVDSRILEKLSYDIRLGNINLNTLIRVALKGGAAYKVTPWFSAGLAVKYDYLFFNVTQAPDITIAHYGFGPYVRAKFLNNFYVQFEYDYHNLATQASVDTGSNEFRKKIWSPMFGGGYMSGFGPWTFGVEILFVANDEVRDNFIYNIPGSVIEYWLGATYNF